jgi:hypothetical protein
LVETCLSEKNSKWFSFFLFGLGAFYLFLLL